MDWSYLFKHWFGTLILGSIIAPIIITYNSAHNQIFDFLEHSVLFLVFGFLFSIPTYLLYSFLYWHLTKVNIDERDTKLILIFFAVAGIISTFSVIGSSMSENGIISYSISSILSGIFFKINFKNDNNKTHNNNKSANK